MKKLASLILISVLTLTGCQKSSTDSQNTNTQATQTETQSQVKIDTNTQNINTIKPILPTLQVPSLEIKPVEKVKIFLVALNDGGKSGKKIGCNDSLVSVETKVAPTLQTMKASLEALFAIKSQYYGQSGLYNALYQSSLKVDTIETVAGKMKVKLSGKFALGGICDDPRFVEQIRSTVEQYPLGKGASILINDKPIEAILSGQG